MTSLIHKSIGYVGTIPPIVSVVRKYFNFIDNHSDKMAALVCKQDEKVVYRLSTYFAKDAGPHAVCLGPKGTNFKNMASDSATRLKQLQQQQAAMHLDAAEAIFEQHQQPLRKWALQKARDRIKANKKATLEADRIEL